jgi:hypothetical protein
VASRQRNNSSIALGVSLIVVGLVFFAVTQGMFGLDWGNIWPVFPMLGGLLLLIFASSLRDRGRRAGLVLAGTIPLLLGMFFLATTMGIVSWSDQGVLWPIYPLIAGLACFAAYIASEREQSGYLIPGAVLSLVGIVFLVILLTSATGSYIARLWPLALIIAGVVVLVVPMVRRGEG